MKSEVALGPNPMSSSFKLSDFGQVAKLLELCFSICKAELMLMSGELVNV